MSARWRGLRNSVGRIILFSRYWTETNKDIGLHPIWTVKKTNFHDIYFLRHPPYTPTAQKCHDAGLQNK